MARVQKGRGIRSGIPRKEQAEINRQIALRIQRERAEKERCIHGYVYCTKCGWNAPLA